jgi:hypothetical protein
MGADINGFAKKSFGQDTGEGRWLSGIIDGAGAAEEEISPQRIENGTDNSDHMEPCAVSLPGSSFTNNKQQIATSKQMSVDNDPTSTPIFVARLYRRG